LSPEITSIERKQLQTTVPVVATGSTAVSRGNNLTLSEIWGILRRRRTALMGSVVVALLLAAIYCVLAPRRYEAVARIAVNPESSNALGIAGGGESMASMFRDQTVVQETQVRILQSDVLAWNVISRLRLDQKPAFAGKKTSLPNEDLEHATPWRRFQLLTMFHSQLKVSAVPKTELLEVRFRSPDPKLASDVVNGLTAAYLERNFRVRYEATMQASDWLKKQLEDLRNKVASAEQRFTEYQKSSGILGTDESHNITIARLEELNKQLALVQAERILREARFRQATAGTLEVLAEIAPTTTLQALRARQVEFNSEYAQLTAKFGSSYPRVVQLRTQIAQTEASLKAEIDTIRQRLEADYKAAQQAERMALDELERQKREAYKMKEAGVQYAILKRELEGSRELYDGLLRKLNEAGIIAGLKSTNIDIVDPAPVPVLPAEPRLVFTFLTALLSGCLVGLGLAFLTENLDSTVSVPEQGEMLGDMPLLCVIPRFRARKHVASAPARAVPMSLQRPNSPFAEAFRALRTTILLSSPGAPPKVVMITSAVPGDGKTMISVNIAVTLAQSKRRVLLVDADMRRSSVHTRLQVDASAGLSDCLAGTLDVEAGIVPACDIPNLHVLPAGPRPPSPAELLDSDRMRSFVELWRGRYDVIVIDTPPLLGMTDAVVLATMSDAVLLVARSARTRRQSLCRARDLLVRMKTRLVGVIINDLDLNSAEHYGYYGYYGTSYGRYYDDRLPAN
jgi:succinoglycan biosynthesis transport protein ExoP